MRCALMSELRRSSWLSLIIVVFCTWTSASEAADDLLNPRPLSENWRVLVKHTGLDNAANQLANELSDPDQPKTNAWSRRAEAEIRTAIEADDLLNQNAWSIVRCSRNGCIAAIDSTDPQAEEIAEHLPDSVMIYTGRLFAYMTPPRALYRHPAAATVQGGGTKKNIYLVFYIFPDADLPNRAVGEPENHGRDSPSPRIRDNMQMAQRSMAAMQWNDALTYLKSAEKSVPLSAYDLKEILEFQGFAYAQLGQYDQARKIYETALLYALVFSSNDALEINHRLLDLSVRTRQWLEAIELGRNLSEHGVATAKELASLSKSYLKIGDCKYALRWAALSIAASDKDGTSPDGDLYQLKDDCDRLQRHPQETATQQQTRR